MGRAPCCDKANVKRGPWSPEEDATLKAYLQVHGTAGNWIALPTKAGLKRCGKSCRLRWLNYLRPDIKHGGFTDEEDHKICNLYNQMGSRWSVIASHLPGRTDNDVKNYWNTKLKKKLLSGKISLATNNTNTKNIIASQIPTNINNTFINHATPEFVKPPNNSCVPKLPEPDGSSSLLNRKAQNPATLSFLTDIDDNNDHGQTVHVQRLSLQHDQQSSLYSPRVFMDLLSDDQGFDNLVPKNTSHTQIMSLLSQDQAGSGTNTSDGINDNKLSNGCEEFGGTALADHFGFGLPYDIISSDHHGVVAPSYCMSTYFC